VSTRTKILIALQMLLLALIIFYGQREVNNRKAIWEATQKAQATLREYLDNEAHRLRQECKRCRRDCELRRNYEEKNHDRTWKWWVECDWELEGCVAERDKMRLERHPAHITPHTEVACKGYACCKGGNQ